jgi:hypothetical protein
MSIPKTGSSSPENQSHNASACGSRRVLTHLDQDDGASNYRCPLAPVALAYAPRLGVQTRPGLHPHRAVVFVLVAALGRRGVQVSGWGRAKLLPAGAAWKVRFECNRIRKWAQWPSRPRCSLTRP